MSAESRPVAGPACCAVTDEGTRLPVVDVANPAFDIEVDEAEQPAFAAESVRSLERWSKVPRLVRRLLARHSLLLDDGGGAADAFVSGMTTYLLKLGPTQLCASLKVGGLDRNPEVPRGSTASARMEVIRIVGPPPRYRSVAVEEGGGEASDQ